MPPRVAFFTDSFHEINGVAHTSRNFVAFAQRHHLPFLSIRAGNAPPTTTGNVHTLDLPRSRLALPLEHDLFFDPLFPRHTARIHRALRAFRPDLIHITGPSELGIAGAFFAWRHRLPLAASWHTNLHEYAGRRLHRLSRHLSPARAAQLERLTEHLALDALTRFYRLARVLFAPNPELCNLLERTTHTPCHLMQRGVDTTLFSPAHRSRPPLSPWLSSPPNLTVSSRPDRSAAERPASSFPLSSPPNLTVSSPPDPEQAKRAEGEVERPASSLALSSPPNITVSSRPERSAVERPASSLALSSPPDPEQAKRAEGEVERPASALPTRPSDATDLHLGFVGRLSPEKNVALLPRIQAQLRALGIHNTRFVLIGHGALEPTLCRDLPDAIFPGILRGEALARAFANLDLLVFPSHTDTFGNVVLEALASGVPALVTPSGGPRHILEAAAAQGPEVGLLCHDDDFAPAIAALRADPQRLAQMRAAARAYALTCSWDAVFHRVYQAYATVLPERLATTRSTV